MDPGLRQAREALLELLTERFGMDGRPGWLLARLERAIVVLAERLGGSAGVVDHLRANPEELSELAERLRVGETRFFRDPEQWQLLASRVLPALVEGGRLRALSAGCSTGEEAWTLAMLLARAAKGTAAWLGVVGVDRSRSALEAARSGVYPVLSTRSMPEDFRADYLTREGDSVRVRGELSPLVKFVERDLLSRPPLGSFHLVVCKNLLIYLQPEARRRLLDWLLDSLEPRGVLLVARSELGAARAAGARAVELGPGVSVLSAG